MSDRRRITAPADTYFPQVKAQKVSSPTTRDGTPAAFYLSSNIALNANGSAYLEVDNYIIQSQIFGPRPIKGSYMDRGSVSVECKFLTLIRQNNADSKSMSGFEHRMASFVETCLVLSVVLEKYPKSTIDVFINVLAANGDGVDNTMIQRLTAWIVNCTSTAVVDAGIEVKDIVTGGQTLVTQDGKLRMDEEGSGLQALVAIMPMRNDEIVGLWIDGPSSGSPDFSQAIDSSISMAKTVRNNINSYLLQQANEEEKES